jgi:TnpA family transposase
MIQNQPMEPFIKNDYLAALKQRGAKARVTERFQLIGLEIAVALKDMAHKALYIKYAKELGAERMLSLAKDVAERRDVKNPAAYFMKLVKELRATLPK